MSEKRVKLTTEEIAVLRDVEHFPRIIIGKPMRDRLKRRGLIKAETRMRKYREMPYGLTETGHQALKEHDEQRASMEDGR